MITENDFSSEVSIDEAQQLFESEVGGIPNLGDGEILPGSGAELPSNMHTGADPRPASALFAGGAGWDLRLIRFIHIAAFASLGEKWALNEEQADLLGNSGKELLDYLFPSGGGPVTNYLMSLGSVVMIKTGLDALISGGWSGANTSTARSQAGSSLGENRVPENPGLWNPSSDGLAEL